MKKAPASTVLYFAYGSNMDPVQMQRRCPGARALGPAKLAGYLLAFRWDSPGWGGGVGDVVEVPGGEVWGVLWDIDEQHEAALDDYESVAEGVYGKRTVEVEHRAERRSAYLYLMAPDRRDKAPSGRYLRALIRGAIAHGIPDPYVESLRAMLPAEGRSRR